MHPTVAQTTIGAAIASAVVTIASACGPASNSTQSPVHLLPVTSTELPPSSSQSIALVARDTVCVGERLEFQVRCVTRSGQVAGLFGRKGEGPGEFGQLSVARGPDGRVGVIDYALDRLTVFRPDGSLISEMSLPGDFLPAQLLADRIVGSVLDWSEDCERSDDHCVLSRYVPTELSLVTGQVLWTRKGLLDAAESDCLMLGEVAVSPSGGLVVRDCTRTLPAALAFFDDRDGTGTVVRSPAYVEEFPNERDLDAYVTGLARLGGGSGSLPSSVGEAWVERFRDKPKGWYRGPFKFDDHGRTYIATTRDRDVQSFIEVWAGPKYLRTLTVRDRLISYDLLGRTLVVLAERSPDADGLADLAIDWYDLPEWVPE